MVYKNSYIVSDPKPLKSFFAIDMATYLKRRFLKIYPYQYNLREIGCLNLKIFSSLFSLK